MLSHGLKTAALAAAVAMAAVSLSGCQPGQTPPEAGADGATRTFGSIAFKPCSLTGVAGGKSTEAMCADFEVPEDPRAPGGRAIALKLAWLPATGSGGGTGDPVFFLAGGPGQAATEHAATVNAALREVRKQRDIVLVDQRGTGGSNPLDCLDADGKPLSLEVAEAASADQLAAFARECLAGLEGRADPRLYTTTHAVADLEAVRLAIGAPQVNLVGGSYGTRVAQQYAATYPQQTRSLVLDGVVPNDLVVGGEFGHTFEDALELQTEHCSTLPACKARFPVDTRTRLAQVMETLEAAPVQVEYRDPSTGESRSATVTPDHVVGLAFFFSYAPQTAALLPLVLDEAAQGRYAPLMALSDLMTQSTGDQMTRGMQWSVLCAEDADRIDSVVAGGDTLLGPEVTTLFFAACDAWPHGERGADFTAPLRSDVPTLLLSGTLDPVTPPRYGEAVAAGLANGRHLVLQGQGHGTLALGCMPKLVGQFIESTDPASLDTACLDRLAGVPPFTSFNGWEP
ncbi:alpha/beta fold hydrolase [Lysobacter sp. A3-1-A15]|uniref:alpha/beta fold hydrolase n=1 Tax=Novilysobacter viscosus TaxID=3098602 RepID=UPI003982E1B2